MRLLIAGLLLSGMALTGAEVPRPVAGVRAYAAGRSAGIALQVQGQGCRDGISVHDMPPLPEIGDDFVEAAARVRPEGFQAIGVAINPNPDLAGFARQYATDFPVGAALVIRPIRYLQQPIMSQNFYVPQMVFIDRKGVIRAQHGGTDPFLGISRKRICAR